MSEEKNTVRVYNTFTGEYEEVEVSREVYEMLIHSEWNMKKKRQTIQRKEISVNALYDDLIDNIDDFSLFPSGEKEPSELIEDQEAYENLIKAIEQLSPVQQRRLKMRFIENLSVKSIATIEGVSEMAVYLSINDAKEKLRKILTNIGKEGENDG